MTGAVSTWVLPPILPAFCFSFVSLRPVGDLMPMPQPCAHQLSRPLAQESLLTVLLGKKGRCLCHADLVKTLGKMMAL